MPANLRILLSAAAVTGGLLLSGCAAVTTPTPNPSRSAIQAEQLKSATDDFQKTMAENLAKATPVLGMTETTAGEYLDSIGLAHRVVERDGEGLVITMDLSSSRIDLYVNHTIVIDITVG